MQLQQNSQNFVVNFFKCIYFKDKFLPTDLMDFLELFQVMAPLKYAVEICESPAHPHIFEQTSSLQPEQYVETYLQVWRKIEIWWNSVRYE